MKLIINRNEWARGELDGSSLLDPKTGKRCCLGIFARALGIPDSEIRGQANPSQAPAGEWPMWLLYATGDRDGEGVWRDTDTCDTLIRTNDSTCVSPTKRERDIAEIFARHDVQVEFTDEPWSPGEAK